MADEPADALVTYVREHAVRLAGVDPAAPLDDPAPLDDLVGDARARAIGKSAHF